MENVKNVNENLINNEEISEDKINVLVDYTPIVKNIKVVQNQAKFGTLYYLHADVEGNIIKLKIDEGLIRYIKTCEKLGKKPFKLKTIVREMNTEKNKAFTCLKLITISGNVYRYFIDRLDVETIDLIYEDYQFNLKNKK